MKSESCLRIIAAALSAALAICAQNTTQDQQQPKQVHFARYMVTDLGTLGGTAGSAFGINNKGHVSAQGRHSMRAVR